MVHVCTGLYRTQAAGAGRNCGKSVWKGWEVTCPKPQCAEWWNYGCWLSSGSFLLCCFLSFQIPLLLV